LLANSPAGMQAAKRLVLDYENNSISGELIADSCKRIADIRVSAEGQAGLNAFLEKRSPPWVQ